MDAEELVQSHKKGERNFAGFVLPAGSDLSEKDLSGADLRNSWLHGINFSKANLVEANLRSANLAEADLRGAKLLGANLRDADLRDADLTDVKGLLAGQLGGTNLSGAKLPKEINPYGGLRNVEEGSDNARKLLFSTLLACVYAWLTIASTTDVALLTNSSSSPLPIIGASIPIVGFYVAAPILLLVLYFYLHLNLQRLWEELADLPAVFPDGKPLDKTAYPWMLNGLVCSYMPRLRSIRPSLSRLQTGLGLVVAWWLCPATILFIWAKYLRRHDWSGTGVHIVIVAISVTAAIVFHRLAAATLRGREREPYLWRRALEDPRSYQRVAFALGLGVVFYTFYLISLGAIEGVHPDSPAAELALAGQSSDLKPNDVRLWAPRVLKFTGLSPFADLREVDVSVKPANWTGLKKDEILLVKRARLRERNLRYADGYRAFLAGADLKEADLTGSYLFQADLRQADLQWANLQQAFLFEANLEEANLKKSDLRGADLSGADLRKANLADAQLEGARLNGAKLQGADLRGVDLTKAVGLAADQIEAVVLDATTKLPEMEKVKR